MATYDIGDDVLGDDLMGDDQLAALLGDETMGDEILGAARRVMARRAGGAPDPARQVLRAPPLMPAHLGVSNPNAGKLPLGFGTLSCANATPTAAGGTLTARPQVPWQGRKLIISISGTNSGNYGVSVRPTIGNRPVLAGAAAIDARSFPANALDNDLLSDSAGPGVDVSLEFVVTPSVGAGDSVIIIPTWIGKAVV